MDNQHRYFTGKPCSRGHVAERYINGNMCVECSRLRGRAAVLARNPDARRYKQKTAEQLRAERRARHRAWAARTWPERRDKVLASARAKRKERAALRPPKPPKPPVDIDTQRAKRAARMRAYKHRHGQVPMEEYRHRRREEAEIRRAEQEVLRVVARAVRAAALERQKAETKARFAASADLRRERGRAWRKANPGRMRELVRAWKRANPEKVREHRRGRDRKSRARRRAWLMKVQKGRCAICREKLGKKTHIDHVIPLALGGPDRRSNLQLTCAPCNFAKGAQHPIDHARSLGRLL